MKTILQQYFCAVVRNILPYSLKEFLFLHDLAGGQDDLIWHKAIVKPMFYRDYQSNDHKNSTGSTPCHLVDDSNKRLPTEKVVEVSQTRPSASLFIENNADLGTFDAVIRNIVAPNGVKEVCSFMESR
ncbi:MAG: hypothetical protein ACLR0I_07955 [Streptococcus salivarius]